MKFFNLSINNYKKLNATMQNLIDQNNKLSLAYTKLAKNKFADYTRNYINKAFLFDEYDRLVEKHKVTKRFFDGTANYYIERGQIDLLREILEIEEEEEEDEN